MNEKHYTEKVSAFLNHELPRDEHKLVGEHLLQCKECRREHDEIKFGFELSQNLRRADAPKTVWHKIDHELNRNDYRSKWANSFFSRGRLAVAFGCALAVVGITSYVYLFLLNSKPINTAEIKPRDSKQSSQEGILEWRVKDLSGKTTITGSLEDRSLKVGSTLETDANSRAEIKVGDIGRVEIAPNSLVKLLNSSKTEHRLALERGTLRAQILAPPRLFIVDTPSAVAVDLGCAYRLDVDQTGNSKLHVTSGYVALERDGSKSIVPAGAFCLTRRSKGLGTPFLEKSSMILQKALLKFDFENGGDLSLETIIRQAKAGDTLTLWHLLSRVSKHNREKVFGKLLSFSNLPDGVTRYGILRLDKNMLEKWKNEMEFLWY